MPVIVCHSLSRLCSPWVLQATLASVACNTHHNLRLSFDNVAMIFLLLSCSLEDSKSGSGAGSKDGDGSGIKGSSSRSKGSTGNDSEEYRSEDDEEDSSSGRGLT
jgi:hypothetical protein